MAKLTAPLLSFFATGNLAKILSFRRSGKSTVAESYPFPKDARSTAQLSWRHMYQKAIALWHALSSSEKAEWEALARPHHMTGYALFLSSALKPNPGLYLPLQGGIMQGDIDMGNNYITNQKVHAVVAYLPPPEQTIPSDTDTQIQLSATDFDYQGDFNISEYRYYVPFDGLALVLGQTTCQYPTADSRLVTFIRKNTTTVICGQQIPGAAKPTGTPCLALLAVQKNDYIEMWFNHDSGIDRNARSGSAWTYLCVVMLARFS